MHTVTTQYVRTLVALLYLCAAPAIAEQPLRIGWVYAMANAPALIAEEKGFFARHGINTELRRFNSGPLVMNALKAGDLDLAYIGMPPVYHAYESATGIRIIAKVNYGQAAMIVNQDSAIRSLADLKGRRIASIRKGSGMDVLLRGLVLKEQAGLDPDTDVQIIHMQARMMEASVEQHVVDAAFTWEPFVSMATLARDARVIYDMNEAVPRYPWYVIVSRDTVMQNRRADVRKVLQAHDQAIDYLNREQDASNRIIARAFHVQEIVSLTGALVTADRIIHTARQHLGWESNFSSEDRKFLQKLMDYSHKLGYLKRKLDAGGLIDASLAQ